LVATDVFKVTELIEMCLNKEGNYRIKRRVGWKIFYCDPLGHLFGFVFNYRTVRPVGVWINEKDFRENAEADVVSDSSSYDEYPVGFHIYLKNPRIPERQLATAETRKVKFRKVVAKGYLNLGPGTGEKLKDEKLIRVVVAKEIFILPKGS